MTKQKHRTLYMTDLDGTLLNSSSVVSARTKEILHNLITTQSLDFSIATARTPATAMPMLDGTGLRLPAVVMAGAALWDESKGSYTDTWPIDEAVVPEICSIYERHGSHPFIYRQAGSMLLAYHSHGLTERETAFVHEREGTRYKRFMPDDKPYRHSPHPALIIFSTGVYGSMEKIYDEIRLKRIDCHPIFYRDIYDHDYAYLEIYGAGVSKATAIRRLMQNEGFDRLVAFGDNMNDLEMLRMASHSVAPSNAVEEVRSIADEVTGCNDDDCVALWIARDIAQ